jgi:hypothetical protein
VRAVVAVGIPLHLVAMPARLIGPGGADRRSRPYGGRR